MIARLLRLWKASSFLRLRLLAHPPLHELEIGKRRGEIAAQRQSFDELFAALFVISHFHQDHSEIVERRGRIGRESEFLKSPLQVPSTRQKRAQIVVAGGRLRAQRQRVAQLDLRGLDLVLEQQIVAEVITPLIG